MKYRPFSTAYRERLLSVARSIDGPTLDQIVEAVGPDENGRTPSRNYVWKTISTEGIKLTGTGMRYPSEVRAAAMELVIGEGLSPSGARKRMLKTSPTAPSRETIAEWCGLRLSKSVRVEQQQPSDTPGDSWQVAWDAADDLPADTPQWIRDQVILAAWLPDGALGPSETYRTLKTSMRQQKRRKLVALDDDHDIDTAAGRRLAA
jgi:hypothetical protein